MSLDTIHLQEKHKNLVEEWEKMQSNIRLLHQERRYGVLDDAARLRIEGDLKLLWSTKNTLPWS